MKRRRIKIKEKKFLMFKDKKREERFKKWNRFLSFFFVISLITFIVSAIIFIGALIIWPIFWLLAILITLGTILIKYKEIPSIEPLLNWLTPVLIGAMIACIVLFVLRFIIKWIFIISESRALMKNEAENIHYIAIAKAVRKTEAANMLVFVSIIISITLVIVVSTQFNTENITMWQKALPAVVFLILIIIPIIGKIYKRKVFSKVNHNVLAVLDQRNKGISKKT